MGKENARARWKDTPDLSHMQPGRHQKEASKIVPKKHGRARTWRFQAEGVITLHGDTQSVGRNVCFSQTALSGDSAPLQPTCHAETTSNMKETETNTDSGFRRGTQSGQFIPLPILTSSGMAISPMAVSMQITLGTSAGNIKQKTHSSPWDY